MFRQDDPARSFFVLVEGRLKVSQTTPEGQRVVVRFIGPGEMFGCVAVVVCCSAKKEAVAVTTSWS